MLANVAEGDIGQYQEEKNFAVIYPELA